MTPSTCFRGHFHSNLDALSGGLFFCCGQLIPRRHGPRHLKCDSIELGYKVGVDQKCNCKFTDPQWNILHQEAVHRSVLSWICPVCEVSFVSGRCLDCHILSHHNSPTGFVQDLDDHYGFCKPPSFSF